MHCIAWANAHRKLLGTLLALLVIFAAQAFKTPVDADDCHTDAECYAVCFKANFPYSALPPDNEESVDCESLMWEPSVESEPEFRERMRTYLHLHAQVRSF